MKLIASDFDKTFFTNKYLANIKKINNFVNEGNLFIIVTGRNITHLLADIKGYNIKYSYLICNDGRAIYDHNLKCIKRYDIDLKTAQKIFQILKNSDGVLDPIIDTGSELSYDFKTPINAIIVRPLHNEKAEQLLNSILISNNNISGYISDNWVNMTSSKSSKGLAIKYIEKLLNIDSNNIYTIGDGINDISMNELYRNSYAVDIADDELKRVSSNIVLDFEKMVNIIQKEDL